MDHNIVREGQYLAVFNSTHRVLRAEGLLKGEKLDMLLIPAPRAVKADCGLAIRFDQEEHEKIMGQLEANDLLPAFLCRYENSNYVVIKEFEREEN